MGAEMSVSRNRATLRHLGERQGSLEDLHLFEGFEPQRPQPCAAALARPAHHHPSGTTNQRWWQGLLSWLGLSH
jgi:hypothetical protein